MEPPKPITDRVFKVILMLCLTVMIIAGIAWAMGWDSGGIILFLAGALMIVPMFHFAMHWPSREKKNPKKPE